MVKLEVVQDDIVVATDRWLKSLRLAPHMLPVAALLRELASTIADPETFTAAAAKEFRACARELVPTDAVLAKSNANAQAIQGRRKTAIHDAPDAKPKDARPSSRKNHVDAGVQTAPMAT